MKTTYARPTPLLFVGLVIGGILLAWFVLRVPAAPPAAGTSSVAKTDSGSAASAPSAPPVAKFKPVDKVRRITKEERAALAGQIENAQKARDMAARGTRAEKEGLPQLEAGSDEQIVKTTMKAAMHEVIPMLTECYSSGGSNLPKMMDVVADLTLTGDADIGTVVDANSLKNKDGTPVNAEFEACVRDTLVTLEMPPLSEGGVVQVTYPFVFAADDGTMPP
jgi:hypothetical protein